MDRHEVEQILRAVLMDWADEIEIRPDSKIGEDIPLDSLEFVSVQTDLEEKLGKEIDPVKIVEAETFEKIVDYLHALIHA